MKIAIMQPYFFPYIGYFQLMNAVDEFVIYDNVEFTKKGWINRNRVLVNGKDSYITLPLKSDSDFLHIRNRCLSETWILERKKMLNRITESYRKAPNFETVFPIIEKIILFEEENLFKFIFNSINQIKDFLEIKTSIMISSEIPIDHSLKKEKRIFEIAKKRGSTIYINPIGGMQLYLKDVFRDEGLELYFLKTGNITYSQFNNDHVPYLSIIDVLMFNSKEQIKEYLNSDYTLL